MQKNKIELYVGLGMMVFSAGALVGGFIVDKIHNRHDEISDLSKSMLMRTIKTFNDEIVKTYDENNKLRDEIESMKKA